MSGDVVNLDALIEREDFLAEEGPEAGQKGKNEISKTDLADGESFRLTLRKPDFQRETAAWSPEAVCDFIKAFIEGDLIPAVICWQSPSRLSFVIDGAHRLSAVMAWLNDDYGAGAKSIAFYDNNIPDEQRRIHIKTKHLVDSEIGAFVDIQAETKHPGSNPRLAERARALGHATIPLLWIRSAQSEKAEHAFLTINRSAVQIDSTELRVLRSRFTPAAIAARAIVRNATGFKYWKTFSPAGTKSLEATAQSTNQLLYSPPFKALKSFELPIAGHGYGAQTLPLIYDFVNIANDLPVVDATKLRASKSKEPASPLRSGGILEDVDVVEQETLNVLGRTSKLARLLTGTHPSSLGLLPAIYFYAANGRHQPTAVLAIAALVHDLEKAKRLVEFTRARYAFEEFLKDHKTFVNQITTQHGSMAKGFRQLRDYFSFVLDQFIGGKDSAAVLELLRTHEKYQRLVKRTPLISSQSKGFSRDVKQMAFLTEHLRRAIECRWCKARLDNKAMHLDHVKDRRHDGLASLDNASWAHPFCNSAYKDSLAEGDRPR